MTWAGSVALFLLLLHPAAVAFDILPGESLSHQEITARAILNVTVRVCQAVLQAEGADFTPPAQPFTAEAVAAACRAPKSAKSLREAIALISRRNLRVDLRHPLNASYHFDDESFETGRGIITEGLRAVKDSNREGNFEAARQNLGRISHPLQDFYSHSNWVELGKEAPNANLLRSDGSIGNIADKSRATCRNCDGDDCRNNILEDVIQQQILTSGYFGVVPIVSTKPPGKCSHGGGVDQTSGIEPTGGINKDKLDSSHGHLHAKAAIMAGAATSQLLEDVRAAAGDETFLRMVGISKGSSEALCLVIDTTESMRDDIAAVRQVAASIIDSHVQTDDRPSLYILVPFNDPGFGPVGRTTDPDVFKKLFESLQLSGGGDEAEKSLSGLQLALSAAPRGSEIFLFTDAPAKDADLKTAVIALIERTQTVVNFMITDSLSVNRHGRNGNNQRRRRRIAASGLELYRDLAETSGGQVVEVAVADLQAATSIIAQTSNSSLVTLLQVSRSPARAENFTFLIDETMLNPTVFITGRSFSFTLTGPNGESQHSSDAAGPLIAASQAVGNLQALQLKKQVGTWGVEMVSENPYSLRVIGQSPIDFLFDFVEESSGPLDGFDVLESRPKSSVNGSLLVSLTGSDSATVTEVNLVEASGSGQVRGVVEPQGSGDFLVRFERIPSAAFVVRVKGEGGGAAVFQRQSPIRLGSSNLTISANSDDLLRAGKPFTVNFQVEASGVEGNVNIRASNSRLYDSTSPSSLPLSGGGGANGTVTLTAPRTTISGTDVTLTIEAGTPGDEDMNYVVLHFTVINTETDFTAPACGLLNLQSNCSGICSSSMWELLVRVSDPAGVDRVDLKRGNGTLNASPAAGNENATLVSYVASCCSPNVELRVADRVGNVGSCAYAANEGSSAAFSDSTRVAQSPRLCLGVVVLGVLVLKELVVQ